MGALNRATKLKTRGLKNIAEAVGFEHSYCERLGVPVGEPVKSYRLEAGKCGTIKLTLSDGSRIVVSVSEWGVIDYYEAVSQSSEV